MPLFGLLFATLSLFGCAPQVSQVAVASSPASPVAVIKTYYAAISARKFRQAYGLWGDNGAESGQTFGEFTAGFKETESVAVKVGQPGRVEGAVGSRYVTIPVTISALTTGGQAQRFTGSYTLRRTVVDGATAKQRRWHLFSADITATP